MFAVIDTNVFVSALITHNPESPTVRINQYIDEGAITPVFNEDILAEYKDVLMRERFHLSESQVVMFIDRIVNKGIPSSRLDYLESLPDEKDRVFYEVSLSIPDSYLVTGNLRHFPITPKVVSPSQMIEILQGNKN